MSKTDDGGPAFPTPELVNANRDIMVMASPGMSLRDWFAGQAMAGFMAQSHAGPKGTKMGHGWGEDCVNSLNRHEKGTAMTLASFAYQVADAMLAVRKEYRAVARATGQAGEG